MAKFIRKSAVKSFVAGKMPFDLSFLPAKAAIERVMLVVSGIANVPAAGWTVPQQRMIFSGIECTRRLRSSGLGLPALDRNMKGRDTTLGATIATGATQPFEYGIQLNFRDQRGWSPTDASPATDFYVGTTFDVYAQSPAAVLAGLTFDPSTTCWLEFTLSPLPAGKVPISTVIGYAEVTGKDVQLPAGDYVDLVLVKNDGSAISAAELGNVKLTLDGSINLIEREVFGTLIRNFNQDIADGVSVGEAIDPTAALEVPIYYPVPPYEGNRMARANDRAMFSFDGTLAANTARLFYRLAEIQSADQRTKGAKKLYGQGVKGVVPSSAGQAVAATGSAYPSGVASQAV